MPDPPRLSVLSLLTFHEVRGLIRRSHAVMMTAFFGVLYAIGSMVLGAMLVFTRVPGPSSAMVIWSPGADAQTWNFPAFVLVAPWGYVSLPFLATWVTILVSVGVAMGTSVAILLVVALVRARRGTGSAPTALGSAAGLTPAMIALVTLGACCGTTAAATAGIGVVAQITGTSTANLLFNSWFLGVFQVAVVWIALIAQELLLRVYGELIGVRPADATGLPSYRPPRFDRRFVVGCLLRAALLIAGVSWALAMLVAWTVTSPAHAGPALWASWILQYELVGWIAVTAAIFPEAVERALSGAGRVAARQVGRALLLLAGLSLAIGAPAPLASGGFEGLANELAYLAVGAHAWSAAPPVFPLGAALLFRWLVQYLFLGGFAIALAWSPRRALRPIRWTVGAPLPPGPTERPATAPVASGSAVEGA